MNSLSDVSDHQSLPMSSPQFKRQVSSPGSPVELAHHQVSAVITLEPPIFKNSLIFQIQRATMNEQSILVELGNNQKLLVCGQKKRYLPIGSESRNLKAVRLNQFHIKLIEANSPLLNKVIEHGRPLDELAWQAAFNLSNGKLLPGCRRDDVISLTQWPNFPRLKHSANAERIAALFAARPTSIELASRILHIPVKELCQFYSAACYAGYTHLLNRKAEEFELKPHKSASIINKMMDRFMNSGQRSLWANK